MKTRSRKAGSNRRTLSKTGRRIIPNKIRRVRERCRGPKTVAVLCRVTKRQRGWLWARLPESTAGITGEISKIKSLFKVHHPREGVSQFQKSPWREGQESTKARQRKATKPIHEFNERRERIPQNLILEEELHKLYLTPSDGCSLNIILARKGYKDTTKWKLKISLFNADTTEANF